MGKSSSAPPPDPRLVEAQIDSLDRQGRLIDQITANSERMLPLQEQQLQLGLAAARRAQDESAADRQWMLGRRSALAGLQDKLIQDASTYNAEGRAQQLVGQAQADVTQAFDNTRQQGLRAMTRMGINPNDGRMAAFNQQHNAQHALALATAANKVRDAARDEGYKLTDRATNALAGYPAMALTATQAGAGYGTAGLGLANTGLAGMNSGYGAALQGAGAMGSNATSAFNAQANYHTQMENAANSGLGSALGLVGVLGGGILGRRG